MYFLSDEDRELLRKIKQFFLNFRSGGVVDDGPQIHRASDIMLVVVEETIPPRPSLTAPTLYEVAAYDLFTETPEDYTLEIPDRTGITIEPGVYFAAYDRNGNWGIIKNSSSSTPTPTDFITCISFTLTEDMSASADGVVTYSSNTSIADVSDVVTLTSISAEPAYSGALGTAISFDEGGTWFVIEVDRRPNAYIIEMACDSHDWSAGDLVRGTSSDATSPILFNGSTIVAIGSFPLVHVHVSPYFAVSNPDNLNWVTGDKAYVVRTSNNIYRVVKVLREECLRIRFKVATTPTSPQGLGATISITPLCPTGSESGALPAGPLNAKDIYNKALNCKQNQVGVAEYDWNHGWWYITHCAHTATEVYTTVQEDKAGTPATFKCNTGDGIDGPAPTGTEIVVQNVFQWLKVVTGSPILLKYLPHNDTWIPVQMRCPS